MATDAKLAALATGQKLARFRRELPLALCSRPRDECGLCLLKQDLKDQDHLFYKMAWGIGTILERIASSHSLQSNGEAELNRKFSITRQKAGKLGPGVEIGGLSLVGRPSLVRKLCARFRAFSCSDTLATTTVRAAKTDPRA